VVADALVGFSRVLPTDEGVGTTFETKLRCFAITFDTKRTYRIAENSD